MEAPEPGCGEGKPDQVASAKPRMRARDEPSFSLGVPPRAQREGGGTSERYFHQVCGTLGLLEPVGATPKRSKAIDMTSWKTGAAVEPPPALL